MEYFDIDSTSDASPTADTLWAVRIVMAKWLSVGLLVLGIFLLCTGLTMRFAELSDSDIRIALTPVLVVPGDRINPEPHSWDARIPGGATWKRLERNMGEPDYLLTAIHNGKVLQCLSTTNVTAKIVVNNIAVVARPVWFQPYGFSSECTGDAGLAFKAEAGSGLTVTLSIPAHKLDFSEDILIIPVWHVNMKDKLVGAALSNTFWTSWSLVSVLGGLLLVVGLILILGGEPTDEISHSNRHR